jgi:peptidoglycan/LPS O-acetylase OafA/YrhL
MERNAYLDGWRGISILSVVCLHLFFYHTPTAFESLAALAKEGDYLRLLFQAALRPINRMGALGVPLFFLISGYIITTLLLREDAANGKISIKAFYVRRLFRIVPAMAIFLLAIAGLDWLGILASDKISYIASATFTCNIVQCDWWHAHLWSLAVEEQFYLVWPAMFALFVSRREPLVIILAIVFFLLSFKFPDAKSFLFVAMGVYLAILQNKGFKFPAHPALIWGSLLFLLVSSFTLKKWFIAPAIVALEPLALAVLFICSFDSAFFRKILSFKPLVAVGRVSYGLYLWQQLFTAPPGKQLIFTGDWQLVLLPLIVYAQYKFVEVPLIAAGRRYSARIQQPIAPSVTLAG